MFGIFSPIGVGLLVISAVTALIGLMHKNRRLGWTLTAIGTTLFCLVLY